MDIFRSHSTFYSSKNSFRELSFTLFSHLTQRHFGAANIFIYFSVAEHLICFHHLNSFLRIFTAEFSMFVEDPITVCGFFFLFEPNLINFQKQFFTFSNLTIRVKLLISLQSNIFYLMPI